MRVRISYTVDLDDVPSECSRMLQDAASEVNKIYEELESLVDCINTDDIVEWRIKDSIDRCRQKLAKIDLMLSDNDMILAGYFSTKNSEGSEDVVSEG